MVSRLQSRNFTVRGHGGSELPNSGSQEVEQEDGTEDKWVKDHMRIQGRTSMTRPDTIECVL